MVKTFSDEIAMEFGLDKCAKATFKHGKIVKSTNIVLNDNTVIRELDQESKHKYLGVNESNDMYITLYHERKNLERMYT